MRAHHLALWTTVATWLLLLIGGLVNPMGASMACPDWYFVPTCNGELLPEMTGGVLYEHGHRLWASWVGIMTLAMAASVWLQRRDDVISRRLALLAVALVALQGTLGGITVLLNLHPAVSTVHLGTAMVFFCLLIVLTFRLWPSTAAVSTRAPLDVARGPVVWAIGLVFVQILLGGLVRHLGAGLICGDDWLGCGPGGAWLKQGLAHLHMTHRVVGYVIAAVTVIVAGSVAKRGTASGRKLASKLAFLPVWLVFIQIGLGWWTIASGRSPWIVTLHTGVAALLLTALLVAYLALGPQGARIEGLETEHHGKR